MATAEIILPILGGWKDVNYPPGTAWAETTPYLTFDGTTDEMVTWAFRMPDNYASGLTVKWQFSMLSATSGVIAIRSQVAANAIGVDPVTNLYDTLEKSSDVTVPVTAGLMAEISTPLTNLDSLSAGNRFAIRLGRENATTGTNAIGDMAVWSVTLTYTTT